MDMLNDIFRTFILKINYVEDPVEAAKRMVSSIQQLVGIRNVFGDKKRSKYKTLPLYIYF